MMGLLSDWARRPVVSATADEAPSDAAQRERNQRERVILDWLGIYAPTYGAVTQDVITALAERVRDLEAEVKWLKGETG